MSAVLCLPTCLCVSAAASRGQASMGPRQKHFAAAELPSPRAPPVAFEGYEQHPNPEDSKTITEPAAPPRASP